MPSIIVISSTVAIAARQGATTSLSRSFDFCPFSKKTRRPSKVGLSESLADLEFIPTNRSFSLQRLPTRPGACFVPQATTGVRRVTLTALGCIWSNQICQSRLFSCTDRFANHHPAFLQYKGSAVLTSAPITAHSASTANRQW